MSRHFCYLFCLLSGSTGRASFPLHEDCQGDRHRHHQDLHQARETYTPRQVRTHESFYRVLFGNIKDKKKGGWGGGKDVYLYFLLRGAKKKRTSLTRKFPKTFSEFM